MPNQFNIEKIATRLDEYKEELESLYTWNPKLDRLIDLKILSSAQREVLQQKSSFLREIDLKCLIGERMAKAKDSDPDLYKELCLWVIKDWGGISAPKDDDTFALVEAFLESDRSNFNRIASTSKVASFLYPEDCVIYDSRVAYSLNWIILAAKAGEKFFPIPEGRNSRMAAFDLNVLIRIHHVNKYRILEEDHLGKRNLISSIDKELFIPINQAYSELNRLIKEVSGKLWDIEKSKKLYYTEMLLFSIADRQVYKEITDAISLNMGFEVTDALLPGNINT